MEDRFILDFSIPTEDFESQDEALEALCVTKESTYLQSILFINERVKPINAQQLDAVKAERFIVAMQSKIDGKFSIAWRHENTHILNVFNDIDREDMMELSRYVVEFIENCSESKLSGVETSLSFLINQEGLNIFLSAASQGETRLVKILLEVAFNVDSSFNDRIAADYAYASGHFETLLSLLQANSRFPSDFSVEMCSDEIKEFTRMSEQLHADIEEEELDEIQKCVSQHANLRYFYSTSNQSAPTTAIKSGQLDVYELLLTRNVFFGPHEDEEAIMGVLDQEDSGDVRDIHFSHKRPLQMRHVNALMKKSFVGHDQQVNEKFTLVRNAYRTLSCIKSIEILLKLAALLSSVHIVFDFHRDSVHYLDPTKDSSILGLFYSNGRIYVGAKQMLDVDSMHITLATLVHELCHYIMFIVFDNLAKPYEANNDAWASEFALISEECERNKEEEEIVRWVYDFYPAEYHHAELIVRVPHILAHYFASQVMREDKRCEFKSLFEFYELNVVPMLENKLLELETMFDREIRKKDRKISLLKRFLIVLAVLVPITGLAFYLVAYDPDRVWSDLSENEKDDALNSMVRYKGVELRFNQLFNESDSNVFDILNPSQIKVLLSSDEVFDLSESQNGFLESEIYLIYENMTTGLKMNLEASVVNFQGRFVPLKSLISSDTFTIYESLNTTQTADLLQDKRTFSIGREHKNTTELFIERRFRKSVKDIPGPVTFINFRESDDEMLNASISANEFVEKAFHTKISLVSDDAGNGKTTIFQNLAMTVKENFPHMWVEYVDLKAKVKFYNAYNFDENFAGIFNLKSEAEAALFNEFLKNGTFVVFWDAFDEISPTYSDNVLTLIDFLNFAHNVTQFVSTRPHYEALISQRFAPEQVYKLLPLLEPDNREYLEKFFVSTSDSERAMERAKNLSERVEVFAPVGVIRSPLLLYMIAKVSAKNESDHENVNSMYSIYTAFVEMQLNITSDRGPVGSDAQKSMLFTRNFNLMEVHQYYALKAVFERDINHLDLFLAYDNSSMIDPSKLSLFGLLVFDEEGKADFAHRTFRELFIAHFLVDNFYEVKYTPSKSEIIVRVYIVRLVLDDVMNVKQMEFVQDLILNYIDSTNYVFGKRTEEIFMEEFKKSLDGEDTFLDLKKLLKYQKYLCFERRHLESLWKFRENITYFHWRAIREPHVLMQAYESYKAFFDDFFPNDIEMMTANLIGENMRGNYLLAARFGLMIDEYFFVPSDYFAALNVSVYFAKDFNLMNFANISDLYHSVKSHLSHEEKRRIFNDGLFEFYNEVTKINGTIDELEELLSPDEIENYFCTQIRELEANIETRWFKAEYMPDIAIMFEKCPEQRTFEFLYTTYWCRNRCSRLVLNSEENFLDNFYTFWHFIGNYSQGVTEKRKFLLMDVENGFDGKNIYNPFMLYFLYGEHNETYMIIRDIYKSTLEADDIKEIALKIIASVCGENLYPKKEIADIFTQDLIKSFSLDEMKREMGEAVSGNYRDYRRAYASEGMSSNYPFYTLFKLLFTDSEIDEMYAVET